VGKRTIVAVDTETTGLISWGNVSQRGFFPARPFAISWCWNTEKTGYARFDVDPWQRKVCYDRKPKTFKRVQQILGDPNTIKVLHHAPFDVRHLTHAGFKIRGPILDTLLLSHIATHGAEFRYDLKTLGEKFFDFPTTDVDELRESTLAARQWAKAQGWCIATEEHFGKKPWVADYWLADKELCKKYAVQDAERTMLLYQFFMPIVEANPDYKRVFKRETKLYIGPIRQMEFTGMRVFPNHVDRLDKYYTKYIKKQEKVMAKEVGRPLGKKKSEFNPNSGPQKQAELVEKRGLEVFRYTPPSKKFPNGQPQVSGHFLQVHAENGEPLCRAILEWANARRAIRGFIKTYRQHMIPEKTSSGRIHVLHPQVRGIGAITGRMSSHDPNLMNVASETTGRRRSNIALKPRECLGPRPEHLWYLPDFGQLEVWIFAKVSENETMMKVLNSGGDFHGQIGKIVFGSEPDYKDRLVYYRKCGKLIIFQTLYGGGIKKLSQTVPCSMDKAAEYKKAYMTRLGDIDRYIHRLGNRARKDGFVKNIYGRHSFVHPDYTYKAVNYLVQGTAADVQKEALINVYQKLQEDWRRARILISLHDEMIIELPEAYHSKRLMRDLITCMQRAGEPLNLPKPLPVGVKVCRTRWHKTKEIELEAA
jgi:DNA polymerase-1